MNKTILFSFAVAAALVACNGNKTEQTGAESLDTAAAVENAGDTLASEEVAQPVESVSNQKIEQLLNEMESILAECEPLGMVPTAYFSVYADEEELGKLKSEMTPEQANKFESLKKRLAKL